MKISGVAQSHPGLPARGGVKAEGNGAGSARSAAAASAGQTSFQGDRLRCLLMLLLFSLAQTRSN